MIYTGPQKQKESSFSPAVGTFSGILYIKIKYHYLGEEVSSGIRGFDVGLERQWRTCDEEALEIVNFSPGPPCDLGTSLIYFLYIWKVC